MNTLTEQIHLNSDSDEPGVSELISDFIGNDEAANLLGIKPNSLKQDRVDSENGVKQYSLNIPFYKIGKRVRYSRVEIMAHVIASRVTLNPDGTSRHQCSIGARILLNEICALRHYAKVATLLKQTAETVEVSDADSLDHYLRSAPLTKLLAAQIRGDCIVIKDRLIELYACGALPLRG